MLRLSNPASPHCRPHRRARSTLGENQKAGNSQCVSDPPSRPMIPLEVWESLQCCHRPGTPSAPYLLQCPVFTLSSRSFLTFRINHLTDLEEGEPVRGETTGLQLWQCRGVRPHSPSNAALPGLSQLYSGLKFDPQSGN